ncbi:MAG: hypothetical protein IPF41_13610 [Flavobacteriales bacterium]|nr:hypothetical protein [Flavobacteriales bacterium]
MNRSILTLSAILLSSMLNAQFNWQWARQLTSETQPSVGGLAVDAAGNTVVCGSFYGELNIAALPVLTSNGQSDIYVAMFDPDGTPLWVRSAGGANFDDALDLAIDGEGRITITGYFESPSITVGGTTLTKLGNMDILVAQYDATGNAQWAKRYGWTATSGLEWGRAIVSDANNDLYVAGQYKTALQVPGLPDLQGCNGREQGFLMKLDANGNGLWSLMPQCTGDASLGLTTCDALALAPDGSVYLGGDFRGDTAYFATDTLPNFMPSGQSDDAFVVKYSPAGQELWVRTWAGTNYDEIRSLATDSEGNILVATTREGGYLIDGIDLPFAGSNGNYRMTLWKMTSEGAMLWGRRAGDTSFSHEFNDLAVDANDHVWAGGFFESRCTFDDIVLPNNGNSEYYGLFVAHYDADGVIQEVFADRAQGPRGVGELVCDASGGLYVAGAYTGSITFAPLTPLVGDASFLVKSDDLTTGMTTSVSDHTWSVAPVPADGHFVITHREGASLDQVRVLDAMGREVLRTTAQAGSITIDCAAWAPGSYVVHCGDGRQQIIVLH